jgi:two-component system response regulator BaeR
MTDKQKILIVEDDYDIAESLTIFYQHHNFKTSMINDGSLVVDGVRKFEPDLIIMDLMLPNKSGVDCCKEIRQFSNVPIIMLTAKVEQIDKLIGLESGADDYVCKPFDVMELILRSKAILNRTDGNISFSKISIEREKGNVIYQGKKIDLSIIEYNLFHLLYSNPGRIFSRDQILHLAYPEFRHITDRTIDSHVKKIRNKFKDVGISENPIESIYGAGYRVSLS